MPEGHTLQALARDLHAAFAGTAPQITSPQGRFAAGANVLSGHTVLHSWARGKLLFIDFEHRQTLFVHLGLIGTFRIAPFAGAPPPARGAVRLRMLGEHVVADLRGPMACQVLTPPEVSAKLAAQGPDPLDAQADPDRAWAKIHASRRSIAELLMDQGVLAGVGNVYRCEVLFRNRVKPSLAGERLKLATWQAMWGDLVELMPLAVTMGRIITRDEDVRRIKAMPADAPLAGAGRGERERLYVYQRDGQSCQRCGSRIRTRLVAGRNLFWCGNCQRRA